MLKRKVFLALAAIAMLIGARDTEEYAINFTRAPSSSRTLCFVRVAM